MSMIFFENSVIMNEKELHRKILKTFTTYVILT